MFNVECCIPRGRGSLLAKTVVQHFFYIFMHLNINIYDLLPEINIGFVIKEELSLSRIILVNNFWFAKYVCQFIL